MSKTTLTWYTIIAAFWLAFLTILGVNLVGNTVMFGSPLSEEHEKLQKFGFPVEVVADTSSDDKGGAPVFVSSLPLVATAKVEDGAAVFKKCGACHTAVAGGPNMTGPNLHNIIGDAIGDRNGFKTTDSLKAMPGGKWTYEILDDYIENPKHLAPKGAMSFIGLKKPQDRAAVIKFLMSQTDNPPPIPAAAETPAAAPAAAAPAAAAPAK
jgi:cytochrome c